MLKTVKESELRVFWNQNRHSPTRNLICLQRRRRIFVFPNKFGTWQRWGVRVRRERPARGEDMIRLEGRKGRLLLLILEIFGEGGEDSKGWGWGFHVGHLQVGCQKIFE